MATERLYLQDVYATSFDAKVLALRELNGKPAVVLERSAFYPEGGGQPGDQGTLGAARVLDTQDVDGEVLHQLDRPLEVGAQVHGQIDWARRLEHMQQHHGQHLLSAAFLRVLEAPTTSFHLGERTCTIDLACSVSKLDDKALRKQVMSIETDSTPLEDPKNPDTCKIFAIYQLLATSEQTADLREKYKNVNRDFGYGHAKQMLFELITERFRTEREKYNYYVNNREEVDRLLRLGAEKARKVARGVLDRVRHKLGY